MLPALTASRNHLLNFTVTGLSALFVVFCSVAVSLSDISVDLRQGIQKSLP